MARLAVLILTFNEARHIGRALASVAPIASEVFVIDSGSTDATVAIARAAGATVFFNPWTSHARQFQWGLDHAPITADWILRLDADEVIEPDLAAEITERLDRLPPSVTGVNLRRKHIFMGRWIRHGGRYPLTLLRLWRTGKGRIEQRWMDEHAQLTEGVAVTFKGGFRDHNFGDLSAFTAKHNRYATLEAVDVLSQRYGLSGHDATAAKSGSRLASGKRWLKETLYNRLPIGVGPLGYFLYRYVVQLGFLDGRAGLIYHGLQGFWYRFLVAAKVAEFQAALAPVAATDRAEALERLADVRLIDPKEAPRLGRGAEVVRK
jgi:glycosyltransferase involved in cell wall biosynthesis